MDGYSFCGGDPVNHMDPDGRCIKGFSAGLNDGPIPANASQAFMAGYYPGGTLNGFNQGANEGAAIEANTFTFGQVNSLNTYANSLQGGVYDFTRGASYTALGAFALAGGGALYGTPAVFNAGVAAAYNPWTYVAAGGVLAGADAYQQGASPGGVFTSTILGAGLTYSQNPFPVSFGNNSPSSGATQLEFNFVNELPAKPAIQWPPNGGFADTPASATLVPGTTVDRYGYAGGSYVSPTGTPFIQRSLAPGTQNTPYNIYTVLQPIPVNAGQTAPAFDMPGGGMQYKLPSSVQSLIDSGHLGAGH
jgi:hypothetical protein